MGQRPKRPTEERRVARQRASDELCAALGVEPFEVGDDLEIPPSYSPQTSPLWPQWHAHATRAFDVPRPWAPRKARGVGFSPFAFARQLSAQRRNA